MPLTNAIWGTPVDPTIAQAAADTRPIGSGDRGPFVVTLKNALARVGYEHGLDETDTFGPYTHAIVVDFQDLYNLPKTGAVGKQTIETIDKLLNGVFVAKNAARTMAAANPEIGANFARLHIPQTKDWVRKSFHKCDSAYKEFWQGNEIDFDTALALLFHFRIVTTDFSEVYALSLGPASKSHKNRFLDGTQTGNRYRVVEKLRTIRSVFSGILLDLNVKNGSDFVDYIAPILPAKDEHATHLAWAQIDTKRIYFNPKTFFAKTAASSAGKDVRSASWVVVHELAHMVIGKDSVHTYIEGTKIPLDNSYSSNSQYYFDNADKCVNNADSYAHFAYQLFFGQPNVGPY
jgi:putative peptidoglycan binding protein